MKPKKDNLLIRKYETLVRLLIALPHKPFTLDAWKAYNRHGTAQVIRMIKELGIAPRHLVDVGANESQWAYWLMKEWPDMRLDSFEPLHRFRPQGVIHRLALSDNEADLRMVSRPGGDSHIAEAGDTSVKAVRFDSLPFEVLRPAICKIDCENFTSKALCGFGDRINEFEVVVVEMLNEWPRKGECLWFKNQQPEIWSFMLKHGFTGRLVDFPYSIHAITNYDMAFYKPRS
jgi:FkbM family methyltransferase